MCLVIQCFPGDSRWCSVSVISVCRIGVFSLGVHSVSACSLNVRCLLRADALAEVDVWKHTASQLEESVVDKEREIQRRLQAVREEEWQKLHKLDSDK